MLCEKCQEREATCFVHAIADGVSKSRDLCNECFEAESPEAKEHASVMSAARCQYCCGQPCAGGTDILALITGVQQMKYLCMTCSLEHGRFVQQQLKSASLNLSQQEQLAAIRMINIEADKHMEQWVSDRGSQ
jgi:protein-arginine kinase activator protein McsA